MNYIGKGSWVILKLDFKKAYDKIKWPFVQQTLRMKGFSSNWFSWICSVISGGHVVINMNGEI
jgi:endo-1,4-beta-D-glucanase Y